LSASILRGLFLADGLVFFLVGVVVMFMPAARAAALPPEAGDTPHLRDTRRLLASVYLALGMFLLAFGSGAAQGATLRLAAQLRGASLLVMVGVNIAQLRSGNWMRGSLVPYVVIFPLLAIAYEIAALKA
jgi:FtsH-binding integral membrane protein